MARWPDWELRLIEQYLATQPAPDERAEIAVAQFHATYINAHLPKGQKRVSVKELLPYSDDPWQLALEQNRYTEAEKQIMEALGR